MQEVCKISLKMLNFITFCGSLTCLFVVVVFFVFFGGGDIKDALVYN